jgi:hypothetical protein
MRKLALAAGVSLAVIACAAPTEGRGPRGLKPTANPSAVVATELAFARTAQEKGQWTAFDQYAADDAIMFVPQPTSAKAWLKQRANPAVAVKWQPYEVWMSCDGSLAVTKGAWQRPESVGYFTTVWKRQKNGTYKWVLDQGDSLKQPLPEPEMIGGHVAECSPRPGAAGGAESAAAAADDARGGASDDDTLIYSTDVGSDGSRTFKVFRWTGSGYEEALRSDVAGG